MLTKKETFLTEKIYVEKNGEYLKNNPTWHVEDSPWKAQQILKILSRNPILPKTVAEVGCGAGEILNQLHTSMPNNVRFEGFDISVDAINLAQQRSKERLEFRHGNFLETNAHFDLLLIMDVIEHVDDYFGFLRTCKKKATYTILHIPLDLSVQTVFRSKLMYKRKILGHLHYFTKETALATLADAGYEVIDHFYTAGSIERPRKTLKSKIAQLPRKMLFHTHKDLAVRLLGGFSLLVLVKEAKTDSTNTVTHIYPKASSMVV